MLFGAVAGVVGGSCCCCFGCWCWLMIDRNRCYWWWWWWWWWWWLVLLFLFCLLFFWLLVLPSSCWDVSLPRILSNVAGAMAAKRPDVFNTNSDNINNNLQHQISINKTPTSPLGPASSPPPDNNQWHRWDIINQYKEPKHPKHTPSTTHATINNKNKQQ